jgi:hypothetical protein
MAVSTIPRARGATYGADGAIVRLAWIVGYLIKFGRIAPCVAIRELGASLRTYWRDIARLRAAGFILIEEQRGTAKCLRYGGFDPIFAESVRAAHDRQARDGYVSGTLAAAERGAPWLRRA